MGQLWKIVGDYPSLMLYQNMYEGNILECPSTWEYHGLLAEIHREQQGVETIDASEFTFPMSYCSENDE